MPKVWYSYYLNYKSNERVNSNSPLKSILLIPNYCPYQANTISTYTIRQQMCVHSIEDESKFTWQTKGDMWNSFSKVHSWRTVRNFICPHFLKLEPEWYPGTDAISLTWTSHIIRYPNSKNSDAITKPSQLSHFIV